MLFHFQSVTAYFTMSLLGTVSQSVANTVKRSLLIFATILYFGNPITYLNVAGIVMVSIGDPPARVSPRAPPSAPSTTRRSARSQSLRKRWATPARRRRPR